MHIVFDQKRQQTAAIELPALSIISVIVLANLLYGAVFAPHLATKLGGYVTSGPSEQLFPGVPNQPR